MFMIMIKDFDNKMADGIRTLIVNYRVIIVLLRNVLCYTVCTHTATFLFPSRDSNIDRRERTAITRIISTMIILLSKDRLNE